MDHFSHEHPLILNEVYIAKSGDVCRGCYQEIVSCRSFVYSCNTLLLSSDSKSSSSSSCAEFLLHKSCAELPPTIKHPNHDHVSLYLYSSRERYIQFRCTICRFMDSSRSGFIYDNSDQTLPVCFRCGMESVLLRSSSSSIYHPAHPQHALEFVDHPSSFECHACKVDDNIRDLSYRCTQCSLFWIHKSCVDAPASFQFQFHHKHPLQLSFSLPQLYRKFPQYCRICSKGLRSREWLYHCPKCRFFAHFHCARSNIDKIRLIEDEIYDSEVVHLPAADESSTYQLAEQFFMAVSTIVTTTTNCFRHPAHKEHDLQLMSTINELNISQKHNDEALLLCDGCVKPIRTDQDNQFYGCVPCNFFMHKACAGLPREIDQHHLIHPAAAAGTRLYADYSCCSSLRNFRCFGCGVFTNGIAFRDGNGNSIHIGCLTLPKKIKHEAHNHQLDQVISTKKHEYCRACGIIAGENRYKYWCEKCGYYICARCIMKPKTIKHPWDPHPLSLIYDPVMVTSDHEHEFECEYCSQEIDCTNNWFYHCSECDLSFHLLGYDGYQCFEWSRHSQFSSIKFGATVIVDKLHHHSLTFVFNKKVRSCKKCFSNVLSKPVLECVPCKAIFCERIIFVPLDLLLYVNTPPHSKVDLKSGSPEIRRCWGSQDSNS